MGAGRVQVVKMLALVVAMFATLWLPYRSYVVYNSFARRRYENRWFLLFCRLAVYANSAVNPILYNAMSAKFRSAFRAQLACCCCCCRKCTISIGLLGVLVCNRRSGKRSGARFTKKTLWRSCDHLTIMRKLQSTYD